MGVDGLTLSAGDYAIRSEDSYIVRRVTEEDIPYFVLSEIASSEDLQNRISLATELAINALIEDAQENAPIEFGPDYSIQWADPAFEMMIRRLLERPDGDILRSELDHIITLRIRASETISETLVNEALMGEPLQWGSITRLDDLMHFKSLMVLQLSYNAVSDISALADLKRVTGLTLNGNRITDVSALANLKHISSLNLGSNHIADISPLRNLTQLEYLGVWDNDSLLSDISPLAGMTRLKKLDLGQNRITDISPLSGLSQLEELEISDNPVSDLSPLQNLSKLTKLSAWNTSITDWSIANGIENVSGRP
jgi:hypothetical protein